MRNFVGSSRTKLRISRLVNARARACELYVFIVTKPMNLCTHMYACVRALMNQILRAVKCIDLARPLCT